MTEEGARVFTQTDMLLYGNESQTVGPVEDASAVHHIMLGKGICLLEGVVLKGVKEGKYLLSAAPLNLGGCDGAPRRAYLIDQN
jgi:arylformamidase